VDTAAPKPFRFSWLPLEKIAVWALFLLAVYALRHFFFVMFVTFIVSYIMRQVVMRLSDAIHPGGEVLWLQRVLAVVCFMVLIVALYGIGKFYVPRLVGQGQQLARKLAGLEKTPRAELDEILRDTVGKWLFAETYGGPDDERYLTAFSRMHSDTVRFKEFEDFRQLSLRVEEEFRAHIRDTLGLPDDENIGGIENHWTEFRLYYVRHRPEDPDLAPYDLERFIELREALKGGTENFSQVYNSISPIKEQRDEHLGFELHERRALLEEWKKGELAEKLTQRVQEWTVGALGAAGRYIGASIPQIVLLPVEFLLSLLLSFFITIDMPRLRRGIEKLGESRLRDVYHEIAPGLVAFGGLIGRSFQAQGVVALCNTLLTWTALTILKVENGAFLSSLVFLCSFVPVVGVVFSSIPIAVVAIIQDNGGLYLALWAIGAVLLVHFIETSILNPKIVGDMLHLHPVLVLAILAVAERFFGIWGLLLGVPVVVYIIRYVIQVPPDHGESNEEASAPA
jgi:predicted PurR-regulated permease PerM